MRRQRFFVLLAAAIVAGPAFGQGVAQRWNVIEAGAVGDGQADCTAVFQRLLDEAGKAGGGVVDVPAGCFRINGNLSIPANVTLQGIYRVPPNSGPRKIGNLTGSVLHAYAGRGSANGPPFIRLAGDNAVIAGLIVAYPEWKQTDVPPVPYPPCVSSQDTENVGIRDCCFLNPFEAVKLVRAARHLVRNVTGYPIQRGIFVDECLDIGRIENVHFWPFGVSYKPDDPFCKWVNTQGVAFELARTDWQYVLNTFCFGYGVGYKFSKSKSGSTNGNFLGLGADSCQRAVVVEQAQTPGLLITNGEFVGRWSSTKAVCVEIGPEVKGKVSLVNCSFWGPIDRCVWMRSPSGQFTANACHFLHWDVRGTGSPAIQLDAGKAIVLGCTFNQENLHVDVGPRIVSVILTANQAAGGFRVDNRAGKRAQIALNEEDRDPFPLSQ
ncbi:MAG: glycoside hydrolase family 55 protein [Planctomycetes bacterium]|nr:glycoside hydrolase family 55 protein [Planctomycetota bacterium]MBU4399803.1 glycoside hydrolase family 55 protein [Planctomycetota bacterium]MCG2684318.1 glycoside hydrolase family 55 protein [Planctomycetales bacterium]